MKTMKELRRNLKYTRKEMAKAVKMPFLSYCICEIKPGLLDVKYALRFSEITKTPLSNIFFAK